MFWLLIAGIISIGLLFILAEVLFIPGGILGVVGGLLIIYGIYLPYAEGYEMGAHINLVITLLVLTGSLFGVIRSNTWKRIELSANIDSKAKEDMTTKVSIGEKGISVSRLTPMGKARFGSQFLEVTSITGFVDQQTEIEIINIEQDKIIVKPLNI